jgi:hypothetical protein
VNAVTICLAAGMLSCTNAAVISNNATVRLYDIIISGDANCSIAVMEPSTSAQCQVTAPAGWIFPLQD